MGSWRDLILKEFIPDMARLILVADPDALLLEEEILEGIWERGFELIPFDDPIGFRYAYESRFRSLWDKGEKTERNVVLHAPFRDLSSLPYDLLQAGHKLSFDIGGIFPNLNEPVLAALDRKNLEKLYEAQKNHVGGPLGENATKEFVIRHIFEISPELVNQPSDLLRVLLRLHYREQRIPSVLLDKLIELFSNHVSFADWPLKTLVKDRGAFFRFLQERWPYFLERNKEKESEVAGESAPVFSTTIDGPIDLPFDDPDVRIYLDNLFSEGLLSPVAIEDAGSLGKKWMGIGVCISTAEDRSRRIGKLLERLNSSIPAIDASHSDWLHFAREWAMMIVQVNEDGGAVYPDVVNLQMKMDGIFANWLSKRYAGLFNLPPDPPVMVHHIPRFLSHQVKEDSKTKVALIVVDGLSMDQWLVVREELSKQPPGFLFREQSVFAWLPTLTSVSRQAIFAGNPPLYFSKSIQTTDKEPKLWEQFWGGQGIKSNEIVYRKGLGIGSPEEVLAEIARPGTRIAGLVVNSIDDIMHGMILGTAGMHNLIRQWARQSFLRELLDGFLNRGFQVYLTSDHGNIEANGCGSPGKNDLADARGERVRLYSDAILCRRAEKGCPDSIEWSPVGLPGNYFPLFAPSRKAFVSENQRIVCHGGNSIEETIVPWVWIERKGK